MPIKAMRSSSRIGIAAQEKALVTLSTQLPDDRPKQPAADAAILVCRKKGKHQYFARCVLPEAEPDYRRTIDADVPRKQPGLDFLSPRLDRDAHRHQLVDRDRVLACLAAKGRTRLNIFGNRPSKIHMYAHERSL